MSTADDLWPRWRALWDAGAGAATVYWDLVKRLAESHRAYHTLDHVAACLDWLDAARSLLARPVEAELALWFHDAIYDPRRADNEARSADLAVVALRSMGLGETEIDRVAAFIRLTAHTSPQLSGDGALVCDVDLAILGASPAAFDAYEVAIRQEYGWVPEVIFGQARAHILRAFLARPAIYFTPFFREQLEAQARSNLTAAVARYGV